jgi:hypothetical protein
MEDDRRLFHNAALRKRRKDVTEHADVPRRTGSSSRVHINNSSIIGLLIYSLAC